MANNVTYESNSKAAGWIQRDTEVETEQQGDGSHRQVVKVGNFPTSYPVTDNGGSLTVDATSLPLPTGAATAGSGTYLWNMPIGATGSQLMDVTPFSIFVAPSEILSVTLTGAVNLAGTLSINWSEDI